jgi:hypothetical protein
MAKAKRGGINMPEENRVFDVSKPNQVNPSATSRPIIVGHRPMMNDPMVKEHDEPEAAYEAAAPTRIPISENSSAEPPAPAEDSQPSPQPFEAPEAFSAPAEVTATEPAVAEDSQLFSADPQPEIPAPPPSDSTPPIEGLHLAKPKHRRKWPKLLGLLLILLIAAYLVIDSGLIGSSINLPVHIFKQKTTNPPPATPPTSSNNSSTTSLPTGFKEYKLATTPITFAAPISWGDPTSAPEPGYSKRGDNNQSDGTYAYLVSFATNKDVQVAVTSSKFLPAAARTPLYYDYLQWCVGTSDGKIYESILHFSTANKIDTPTTITCDQGPVASAVKLDSSTIIQAKAVDTTNKVVGDIYTKNLTDPALVVFRVKDAAMTNGDTIKQLLGTVQLAAASSSNSSQ